MDVVLMITQDLVASGLPIVREALSRALGFDSRVHLIEKVCEDAHGLCGHRCKSLDACAALVSFLIVLLTCCFVLSAPWAP